MPLPDFSKEMSQIEEEKNNPSVESVESVEQNNNTNEELTEEEIFKKQKREKLLNHLAKCREKSAEKRRQQKEEKQKNKKPRGRPKKDLTEENENVVLETNEPRLDDVKTKELPPAEKPPVIQNKIIEKQVEIDYDRIINGVHQKYLSSKEERKKTKMVNQPQPVQQPVQPQFDKYAFEKQVREDERNRIRAEVQARKNEEALRKRTKDYYSRLPPRSLSSGKNWDEYFFGS